MKLGGRYDRELREVVESTEAAAVILIIAAGNRGAGMSVAIDTERRLPPELSQGVPAFLRLLADGIEQDEAEARGRQS